MKAIRSINMNKRLLIYTTFIMKSLNVLVIMMLVYLTIEGCTSNSQKCCCNGTSKDLNDAITEILKNQFYKTGLDKLLGGDIGNILGEIGNKPAVDTSGHNSVLQATRAWASVIGGNDTVSKNGKAHRPTPTDFF
ncbi:uncharacterized protein [Rhodnius prolixus]|uniref:uncharacterized protein n=1 Tax=Rhodnius prolixus TaxID=13249 RepID=UPI003D18A74E